MQKGPISCMKCRNGPYFIDLSIFVTICDILCEIPTFIWLKSCKIAQNGLFSTKLANICKICGNIAQNSILCYFSLKITKTKVIIGENGRKTAVLGHFGPKKPYFGLK